MRSGVLRVPILLGLLVTVSLFGCTRIEQRVDEIRDRVRDENAAKREELNGKLLLGNPSNATADAGNSDNYLLEKRSFVMSYSNSRGTANWVAWRTTIDDLGERLPRPGFEPDASLPFGFTAVKPTDYNGSGYDRGHLVPSADRFGDATANAETFLMTNIAPQEGDLNQYPWEKLESYARGIVRRGSDVYTIAGVYGSQRRLRRRVTVPTNYWKIIVVLPRGGTLADINAGTRVIAVDMPNADGIAKDWWQEYLTTVRTIEDRTGYNFLSNLPQDLQDLLETRSDESASPDRAVPAR